MAILGNSDIIVLPDNVNPNTHPDYTELLGSQTQLLAVNENASHLWIFNTSSNLWEKINFLTENIGDGVEIYNDENTDDSYREVRTFNPGDKSIRIHQRDDVLDFRFGGHSFNTFNKTLSGLFERNCVMSNNFDYKTIDSSKKLKIVSVDTVNKTFTTNLDNIYNVDFNPLKSNEKWAVYSYTSPPEALYLGWKINKYYNGTFYYTKVNTSITSPQDPFVDQVIYLSSPFLNYKGDINNKFAPINSNLNIGQTYNGGIINHIYFMEFIRINNKYILFVTIKHNNIEHEYFTYYYSYDGINWTIENNYIDNITEIKAVNGEPSSCILKIESLNENYLDNKIFILYNGGSSISSYKILNEDLTVYQDFTPFPVPGYSSLISNISKYKGKLYLTRYLTGIGPRLFKINNTLKNIIQNNYTYTYVEDNSIIFMNNRSPFKEKMLYIGSQNYLWDDGSKRLAPNPLYDRLSNQFKRVSNSNSLSKNGTGFDFYYTDPLKYLIQNIPNLVTIEKINNKYVCIYTGFFGNTHAVVFAFLRDFSKTTIKKEIKDYIKFEPTEDIGTYNQGNQIIVELWNNTTVNLLKIKEWIGEDFIILNPTGYTITINASSGETIDGNSSISTTDPKIILKSIDNNKIIKYNK